MSTNQSENPGTTAVPRHLPNGEGRNVDVFGQPHIFLVTAEQSGGAFALMEAITPSGVGPPPHIHTREDEYFYILEGEYEFTVGGKKLHASTGDTVFAPRNIPHSFVNVSATTSRALVTAVPGGVERFFVDVSELPAGPPDMALMAPILEKYGLKFMAPSAH